MGFLRATRDTYLAVNGDEGEPGTFKDRYYLERHCICFRGYVDRCMGRRGGKSILYMR